MPDKLGGCSVQAELFNQRTVALYACFDSQSSLKKGKESEN